MPVPGTHGSTQFGTFGPMLKAVYVLPPRVAGSAQEYTIWHVTGLKTPEYCVLTPPRGAANMWEEIFWAGAV